MCGVCVSAFSDNCASQNGRRVKICIDVSEGFDIVSCDESKKFSIHRLGFRGSCLVADSWRFQHHRMDQSRVLGYPLLATLNDVMEPEMVIMSLRLTVLQPPLIQYMGLHSQALEFI